MTKPGRTFIIPVSNGIFAHRERIGTAIWVFLWLVDHTTKEVPAEGGRLDGLVLDGRSIMPGEIAGELELSARAVREHLTQLAEGVYIRKIDKGNGRANGYAVINSQRARMRRKSGHTLETTTEKGKGTPTEKCQGADETSTEKRRDLDIKTSQPLQKSVTVYKETHHTHHTYQEELSSTVPSETVAGDLVLTPQEKKLRPETDPRWKPFVRHLSEYWKEHNPGVPFPFGKPGGQQLKAFLENNPDLTGEQFGKIVRNRSLSQKNHAKPPHLWLPDGMKYAGGPLTSFNLPLAGFSPPKRTLRCVDDPPTPITPGGCIGIARA
jgi:hypothetical protein